LPRLVRWPNVLTAITRAVSPTINR